MTPEEKWIEDQELGTNFIQPNIIKMYEFFSFPSFSLD